LISENYSSTNKEVDDEISRLQPIRQQSPSAITLHPMKSNEENENRKINKSQRVF